MSSKIEKLGISPIKIQKLSKLIRDSVDGAESDLRALFVKLDRHNTSLESSIDKGVTLRYEMEFLLQRSERLLSTLEKLARVENKVRSLDMKSSEH